VLFSFNWAPRHEGILLGEWMYSSTHYLISALDGGEWSASRPGRFIPRERAPGTHWIGGWVGPRAVPDAVEKRKIPRRRREPDPRTPMVQPVAQRYTDWPTTACFRVHVIFVLANASYLHPECQHLTLNTIRTYISLTDLAPWNTVLLEKLIVAYLFKNFQAFCGTRKFIIVFTMARQ
jgi:hypothetical protein